jgi:hypothetical protein
MSEDAEASGGEEAETSEVEEREVPDWEDEYLDRVSDRLMFSYDLEKGYEVADREFSMYGRMVVENQKQLFHPAISYGYHESTEHLFVQRHGSVNRTELESLVELGHDLADDWITPDETHFETVFTFVTVAPDVPGEVAEFVEGFRERSLLKFGYHGHYEINLVVIAPETSDAVGSQEADVTAAFRIWESLDESDESKGLLGRLLG